MRRGPLLMILATLGFTTMIACVKAARAELSTLEAMLWRGVVAAPVVLWISRGHGGLRLHRVGLFSLRILFGALGMFAAYFAAASLPVADHALIWRSEPLFVALLAPLALGRGERPGGRTWGLLVLGLGGCAVLLGPRLQLGGAALLPGLMVLGGAACAAAAYVAIRALNRTETPAALVFWFQVAVIVIAAAGIGWTERIRWPPASTWAPIAGAGIASVVGQLAMTHAYRHDRAAVVAAAGYMGPVWALLIDRLAFGISPSPTALLGGGLILTASAALLFGERGQPTGST